MMMSSGRRKGRYPNTKKKVVDGYTFDSGTEADRYLDLKLLLYAKQIRDLRVHPRYKWIVGGVEIRKYSKRYHNAGRIVVYIADFDYYCLDRDKFIIEDVKMASGHRTEVYLIKKAVMRAMGYELTEINF